jgi:hypothetical protein
MGGSKTAIFTQVVHFYSDGVAHITIGGNTSVRYSSTSFVNSRVSMKLNIDRLYGNAV